MTNARPALLVGTVLLAACTSPLKIVEGECDARAPEVPVCRQLARPVRELADVPAHVRVDARCHWNHTGVRLQPGMHYRFTVSPVEPWVDWHTASDPVKGWTGERSWMERLARPLARVPSQPMYALIGAEGEDPANFFLADPARAHVARTSQELMFFANDWPGRYHNNQGCLDVTVERVRPEPR